jgi:hypothetical protein
MRSIAMASTLLLTLTLGAQELPDAATITKQVQETAKQRKSIEYVKEITGEVTWDGKPVTEIQALGRRVPVQSSIGKQTVALQNPGKARIDLQLGGGSLLVSDSESTYLSSFNENLYEDCGGTDTRRHCGESCRVGRARILRGFEDNEDRAAGIDHHRWYGL